MQSRAHSYSDPRLLPSPAFRDSRLRGGNIGLFCYSDDCIPVALGIINYFTIRGDPLEPEFIKTAEGRIECRRVLKCRR